MQTPLGERGPALDRSKRANGAWSSRKETTQVLSGEARKGAACDGWERERYKKSSLLLPTLQYYCCTISDLTLVLCRDLLLVSADPAPVLAEGEVLLLLLRPCRCPCLCCCCCCCCSTSHASSHRRNVQRHPRVCVHVYRTREKVWRKDV